MAPRKCRYRWHTAIDTGAEYVWASGTATDYVATPVALSNMPSNSTELK